MTKKRVDQPSFLTQAGSDQRLVVDPEATVGPQRMRAEADFVRAEIGSDAASVVLTDEVQVDHLGANARRREANARTPHYGNRSRY